jgi:hypothetical protein
LKYFWAREGIGSDAAFYPTIVWKTEFEQG